MEKTEATIVITAYSFKCSALLGPSKLSQALPLRCSPHFYQTQAGVWLRFGLATSGGFGISPAKFSFSLLSPSSSSLSLFPFPSSSPFPSLLLFLLLLSSSSPPPFFHLLPSSFPLLFPPPFFFLPLLLLHLFLFLLFLGQGGLLTLVC